MNEAVRDCLVTDYEVLIDSLTLPGPGDRHVLAAAIRAGAEVLLTSNLKDFPAEMLARFDVEAPCPDDFLASLLDVAPAKVRAAFKRQREGLRNPPKTAEELLATLENPGLTQVVARLRRFLGVIEPLTSARGPAITPSRTVSLSNKGTLARAQHVAAHEGPKTTKLHDRASDAIDLGEIEKIVI